MGAAIASFPGAQLLLVPRTRFVPVKTTNDLLVLRSDVYTVAEDMLVEPVPERAEDLPFVDLDSRYYKLIDRFEQRFPHGAPSLREARRLIVEGRCHLRGGRGGQGRRRATRRGAAASSTPGATIGQ